jgi:F0F1-type ATP synthase delta subunit
MSLSRDIAQAYIRLCNEGYEKGFVADSVISFLDENNLESLKSKVLEHVQVIEDEKEKYNSVDIKTALPLSAHTTKEIVESICGDTEVRHKVEEDKTLIAGFVARFRSLEWDGSVKGKVERLRGILKEQ